MTEKQAILINRILYYVLGPIMVLEFLLTDMNVIKFTGVIFFASIGIFAFLAGLAWYYQKSHPKFEYKANDLYTKILFAIIVLECLYSAGFFNW